MVFSASVLGNPISVFALVSVFKFSSSSIFANFSKGIKSGTGPDDPDFSNSLRKSSIKRLAGHKIVHLLPRLEHNLHFYQLNRIEAILKVLFLLFQELVRSNGQLCRPSLTDQLSSDVHVMKLTYNCTFREIQKRDCETNFLTL